MITAKYATSAPMPLPAKRASKPMLWTGRILMGLSLAFLLMDAVMKLVTPTPAPVVKGMADLGYPAGDTAVIGMILLVSTILYAIPRTSVLGAILLTGYLGGATSASLRAGMPTFNLIFPEIVGAMVWGGLYLRDSRIRALIPLRR